MVDLDNTFNTPDFTYSFDKFSCWRQMYFAHVTFCYLVFLSGIGCFLTRIIRPLQWTHVWFGRLYIISMLWATATSLLIHNTGLPAGTLISFVWVMGGMTIGWVIIQFHQLHMQRKATLQVQEDIRRGARVDDLPGMIQEAKAEIAVSKTFVERFFSLKALHGMIMFTSWINIAGRIFASNQSGDFTCHTYPVYKPIDTPEFKGANQPMTLVPVRDPDYDRLPWGKLGLLGWGLALSIGPMVGSAVVGLIYSYVASRRASRRNPAADVKNFYGVPQA